MERDVIGYAQKHDQRIKAVGRTIFDLWCKEVVLTKVRERERDLFGQKGIAMMLPQK